VIQYAGGNGSTKEKAVIIKGANSELEGVDAAFNYIERKFGYFELESTTLIDEGDKKFDQMNIISFSGRKEIVWFDITAYYGKDHFPDKL